MPFASRPPSHPTPIPAVPLPAAPVPAAPGAASSPPGVPVATLAGAGGVYWPPRRPRPFSLSLVAGLGIALGILAAAAASLEVYQLYYQTTPLEAALQAHRNTLRLSWVNAVLATGVALATVLGSIDCLRLRRAGRWVLLVATFAALGNGLLGAGIWLGGKWDLAGATIGARQFLEDREWLLSLLRTRLIWVGVLTAGWAALVLTVLNRPRVMEAFYPGYLEGYARRLLGRPLAEDEAYAAYPADGTLAYQSPASAAAGPAARDVPLVAPRSVAAGLYVLGLILGAFHAGLSGYQALHAYRQLAIMKGWGAPPIGPTVFLPYSPTSAYGGHPTDEFRALVELVTTAGTALAGLTLFVGSILGLARVGGGRVVVMIAAGYVGGAYLANFIAFWFYLNLEERFYASSHPYILCQYLFEVVRGQVYPVACFLALRRRA